MPDKKPERWNEPIIATPDRTLTKKQVFDYYNNDLVKGEIMKAVGNREVVVRQSFEPGKDILRRKDSAGDLIKFETPKAFKDLVGKRLSEIHPTFGKHVNFLLADIDPQKNVPWEKTKAIAETVAKTMKQSPDVKKVEVQFSGGRGFYVRGIMDKAIQIDKARELTRKILGGIAKRPDVTFGATRDPSQIRLDTTPLKFRGSVRAPMSLNASTGLVSAPVTLAKLPKVEKSDFTIQKVIKKAAALSKDFSIREMTVDDAKKYNIKELQDDALFRKRDKHLIAFNPDNDFAGFATVDPKAKLLRNLWVHPDARRQGLATKLIETLNPKKLDVLEGNEAAKNLYVRLGFEKKHEWRNRRNPAEHWTKKTAAKMDVLDEANNIGDQGVRVRHEGDAESSLVESTGPDAVKLRAERLAERLKTAATGPGKGEFAPGIPKARVTHPIPEIKNKAWTLAIQQHDAFKAGPHWDVRLVDPETARAHSFAVPKMKFPEGTETILGIQQPTHKRRYALKFEGDIPRGVYGGGSVKMHLQEPVNIIKANANRISFERPNGDKLVMFQMRDKHWGIKKLT